MVVKTGVVAAAAAPAAAAAAPAAAAASIYQQVQLIGEVSIFQNPTYFNYVQSMVFNYFLQYRRHNLSLAARHNSNPAVKFD